MMAFRVDCFGPVDQFESRVDDLIQKVRTSRRLPGVERILIPGERSELLARQRQATGIPLRPGTMESLEAVAQDLSVPLDPAQP